MQQYAPNHHNTLIIKVAPLGSSHPQVHIFHCASKCIEITRQSTLKCLVLLASLFITFILKTTIVVWL